MTGCQVFRCELEGSRHRVPNVVTLRHESRPNATKSASDVAARGIRTGSAVHGNGGTVASTVGTEAGLARVGVQFEVEAVLIGDIGDDAGGHLVGQVESNTLPMDLTVGDLKVVATLGRVANIE